MMYYTEEARMSAINSIRDSIEKIASVKGSELSYLDTAKTIRFLSMLIDLIEKENREERGGK